MATPLIASGFLVVTIRAVDKVVPKMKERVMAICGTVADLQSLLHDRLR